MPKLTVLMPVYNAERFLTEAMDSILQQTFTDFEFLIIDDGSTDRSVAIVQSYSDPRIRFIQNEKNLGISATLNKGIEMAAAEYIARMDADDISYPDRLAKQLSYMEAHPACAMVSSLVRVISEDGQFVRQDQFESDYFYYNLTFICWIYHPTVMYRKSAVKEVGMYAVPYAEDFELFWQLSRKHAFYNLPEVLLDYRVTGQSLHQVLKKEEYAQAQQEQLLRNFRYYAGPDYTIPSSYIDCLQHNFQPLLAEKSVSSVLACIRELDRLTNYILARENVNRDTIAIKKAAEYKRWFILDYYARSFPRFKRIMLLIRAGYFSRIAAAKMKESMIKKSIRGAVYGSFSLLARLLPLWKETEAVKALPPMLSLPVALPVNFAKLPEGFAKQFVKTKSIPARRIFVLKDVCVSGRAVVFKNLRIFTPSLPWLRDLAFYRNGKLLAKQWFKNTAHVPGTETVALAYDNWSAENYYHWMIESLPRLLLLQKKYPDCRLLIPEPAPGYILNTIALLGFNNLLPLPRKDDTVLKVANLVMPELVYYDEDEYASLSEYSILQSAPLSERNKEQTGIAPEGEELIVSVRRRLLRKLNLPPVVPEKRVYVSRSRQKTRRLLNEQEVLPLLEKHRFETVYFEELTFGEQVKLMQETAVFVGLHGSNMVNILFLPTGAKVVEMMNETLLNDAYYLMSSSLGLPYYAVPCTMPAKNISSIDDTVLVNDADLVVDASRFAETLELALQHPVRSHITA